MYIQYLQDTFLFSMTLTTLSFRKRVEFIIHYSLLLVIPFTLMVGFRYRISDISESSVLRLAP